MRRKLMACLLMGVCMLMLTASVFPHHHHAGAICFHHDAPLSAPADACGHGCACSFQCPVPGHPQQLHPCGVAAPAFLLAASEPCLSRHSVAKPLCGTYRESLHSLTVVRRTGLRAPPCI